VRGQKKSKSAPLTGISPDPGDDPFCLCAEQGRADFVVTLNPKDFPQDRLKATVVLPEKLTAAR